jgi:membrane protein YdbS with pleckstrin-like domain
MSSFSKDLMEGERIVQRAHVSWVIYLPALLVLALAAALTVFLLREGADGQEVARFAGPFVGLCALFLALRAWIRRGSARFAVTNKRVFIRYGFVRQRSTEILLSQVEGISVTQGFWARLLDYGTVVIEGTGGDAEPYLRIDAPLAFRRAVQEQIEQYSARAPAPSAPSASAPPPDRYAELLRLDGLKQKGILSEEEFQREKQRILNQ